MNGNNIIVSRGGTAIAGVKSNEIQVEGDTIEIASTSSGAWREYLAGRKGWSLSVSYLMFADTGLAELLNEGTTYTISVSGRGTGASSVSGSAILKTCKITASRGNLVHGSFQFVGTGALS